MLCDKCSNIHFKPLRDYGIPVEKIPESGRNPSAYGVELYHFHHENKEVLELSANGGCHFCSQIWESLFGNRPYMSSMSPWEIFAGKKVYLKRLQLYTASAKATDGQNWRLEVWPSFSTWQTEGLQSFIACCEGIYCFSNKVTHYPEPLSRMLRALTNHSVLESKTQGPHLEDMQKVTNVASKGHATFDYLHEFSPENDTTTISTANLRLAQCWLRNCLENHIPCRSRSKSFSLPRRVVDVTDPHRPFLVFSSGIHAEYVALSYKWGDSSKYVTCESNYGQHLDEIPLEKLPKTFQEAITVTRFMGFRFLWIDALCIVQDNAQDKNQDVHSMDRIFQCATLTLFAALGDNANAGLSNKRNPASTKPCELQLASTISNNYTKESAWVTLGRCGIMGPLHSRGWVLQEEILSRRRLAFEENEMTWHCLCEQASEMKPMYGPVASVKELLTAKFSQWSGRTFYDDCRINRDKLSLWIRFSTQMENQNRINLYNEWYKMVSEYSTRSLTFASDALPALAGLANAVKGAQSPTYKYGLWEEDLQVGLCWSVGFLGFPILHRYYGPPARNGPTWSWSSVWGEKIDFSAKFSDRTKDFGVQLRQGDTSESLRSGWLTLSGRIKLAIIGFEEYWWGDRWEAPLVNPGSRSNIGKIKFDRKPKQNPDQQQLSCLLCIAEERRGSWEFAGLGLVPVDDELNVYRRIGFLRITDKTFFGHLSEKPTGLDFVDGRKYVQNICLV